QIFLNPCASAPLQLLNPQRHPLHLRQRSQPKAKTNQKTNRFGKLLPAGGSSPRAECGSEVSASRRTTARQTCRSSCSAAARAGRSRTSIAGGNKFRCRRFPKRNSQRSL